LSPKTYSSLRAVYFTDTCILQFFTHTLRTVSPLWCEGYVKSERLRNPRRALVIALRCSLVVCLNPSPFFPSHPLLHRVGGGRRIPCFFFVCRDPFPALRERVLWRSDTPLAAPLLRAAALLVQTCNSFFFLFLYGVWSCFLGVATCSRICRAPFFFFFFDGAQGEHLFPSFFPPLFCP